MKPPSMGSQDVATPQEIKTYSRLAWTRAQDANTHDSVYGGWLLRASIESAVIAIRMMIGKALPLSRSFPKVTSSLRQSPTKYQEPLQVAYILACRHRI